MSKASTYQRRARDFAQRENWDAALAELRQAIAADAANPMLHNQMGDLFLRKEEVQQACLHFEKAIDLYTELGLHANAVALCRKVIRLCPSRVEVRFRLARLRHDQGLQSETTASFIDYLEHLPAHSDSDVRNLEERCREIVEQFPQAAPIGKILEKLEAARAFVCAFELVQRLAQRAADAGDDEAARRYTTKMRSLRVLVEGRGGDLPGKTVRDGDARQAAAAVPGFGDLDLERAGREAPAPAAVQPNVTPREAPADALQIEDIRGTIAPAAFASAAPEAATDVPEIDLDVSEAAATEPPSRTLPLPAASDAAMPPHEYELPETSLADIANLFATSADAAIEPAPEPSVFEIEVPEALASPPPEPDRLPSEAPEPPLSELESLPPEGLDLVSPPLAATSTAASESTESLAPPVGSWFETVHVAPGWSLDEDLPPVAAAPSAPSTDEPPVLDTDPDAIGVPELPLHDVLAPTSVEAVADASEVAATPAVPVVAHRFEFESAALSPLPLASPPAAAVSLPTPKELFAPVWVPDESSGELAGPEPQEGGSTHELLEVIDTFRRQMALALGDDAAARYDLGVAYFEMGLYEEAMDEFEVARGSATLRERSLEMMAACMAMQGRHAEILDLLAPALQMQPDPRLGLGLRFSMGVACEALGRRGEARQHFEAVAQVDSSYRDVGARLQRF